LYAIRDEEEMTGPAYPAAHAVAPKVHAHFARHTAEAAARGISGLATVPEPDVIEAMIDAAFWASLRREEIYVPKISLAFLSPLQTAHPLMFGQPLTLEAAALVRLAPAVERAGIHLGVWTEGGGLAVWGTTRVIPPLCIVIEVAAPGLLVIKHHRGEEAGKYVNVAVLEGDRIKVVDEQASSLPDCPSLLTSLLGFDSPASWVDSVNLMVQLAVSMRTHGRGGSLLVVPAGSEAWLDSMVRPMPYAVVPPFGELSQLQRETPDDRRRRAWQETVARSVEAIAGLTAVDGATVLTTEYQLLAFGAKIARRKGSPQVEQVTMTEPIEGGTPALVHPTQLGGSMNSISYKVLNVLRYVGKL
jgi:hypothetical protein